MSDSGASASQPRDPAGIRRERDRFVALAFCASDVLFEVSREHVVLFAAGASLGLVGVAPEKLIGRNFLDLMVAEDRAMVTELIKRLRTGDRLAPLPVRLDSPRGPSPPLELNGYSLPDLDGSYFFGLRLVGSAGAENGEGGPARDVESGLLDAAAFAQMASRRAREAQARGEEVSLMTVRLDETAGLRQATHDHLVRTIGAYLRAGSVGGDSAGRLDESSYGFLHRPDLDVSAITARIEAHVRAHGASLTTGRVERAATLLADADDSMAVLYAIKAMCDKALQGDEPAAALDSLVRDAASQARTFRDILATGQFEFAFQPIVNLETRVVHHHEVLVRFPSELGASPQQLIVFAESTGLISEFDLAMTRRLLEWLDAERAVGKRHKVAVNLSARSFASVKFGEALHKLLDRFPAVRAQLMFELTESARIDDLDAVNEFIKGLRAKGHKVCLDDFGAGATALPYIHKLDVDIVKIDGSHVRAALTGRKERATLKAIVGICRDIDVATVAEMVEDESYLPILRQCGVEFGQGYYFGRPSPMIGGAPKPSKPAAKGPARQDYPASKDEPPKPVGIRRFKSSFTTKH